ncbi:MAG: hypothetical protein IAE90_02265 [Ignavibacteria bacterium]|nr:hypothetical protein [Ignavibacteria bacterium]
MTSKRGESSDECGMHLSSGRVFYQILSVLDICISNKYHIWIPASAGMIPQAGF